MMSSQFGGSTGKRKRDDTVGPVRKRFKKRTLTRGRAIRSRTERGGEIGRAHV